MNFTAVRQDDRLGDGKAQAKSPCRASPGRIGAPESLEQVRQIGFRDSRSFICDEGRQPLFLNLEMNPHFSSGKRVANSIVQQVVEHLP